MNSSFSHDLTNVTIRREKMRVTGANGTSWSAEDALYEMINYFETLLYGVLEMKSDNMFDLIDQTNNQIFREL